MKKTEFINKYLDDDNFNNLTDQKLNFRSEKIKIENCGEFMDFLIDFLDKIIFLKFSFFYNHGGSSIITFKAMLIGFFILPLAVYFFFIIFSILISFITIGEVALSFQSSFNEFKSSFGANYIMLGLPISSVIYWELRKRYSEQWTYCASIMNSIMNFDYSKERDKVLLVSSSLVIDIFDMKLYNTQIFKTLSYVTLEKSIRYVFSLDPVERNKILIKVDKHYDLNKACVDDELDKIKKGDRSIKQARRFLAKFQNDLDSIIFKLEE